MKEFNALTGGRYTYADDLENLQELALAFGEIFDDCSNFIISGCDVSGNSVSAGYVYLNGKIRKFAGASGISTWPQYIYEHNYTESVPYESGNEKVGRNVYGCAIGTSVPSGTAPLTGSAFQSIQIEQTGGLLFKDAFIGKYALQLNPQNASQTVNKIVNFGGEVVANDGIISNSALTVKSGTLQTTFQYNGSVFNLCITGGSKKYEMNVDGATGFEFLVNDETVLVINNDAITFSKPIIASEGKFGVVKVAGTDVYCADLSTATDFWINRLGCIGSSTASVNTIIGNGKEVEVVRVQGSNKMVTISGPTIVSAKVMDGLRLKSQYTKTSSYLTSAVTWIDSADSTIARIGYASTSNQIFSITNTLSSIQLTGTDFVNIGPAIKENGVLLSEKYVLVSDYESDMAAKASVANTYSVMQADAKFATVAGGFSQFVSQTVSASTLRSQIGAASTTDLNTCAKLTNYLSDMATSDAAKQKIRQNIGAVSADECQAALDDSGWIYIQDSLYARQIGNIVSIQGKVTTTSSGTVFTIPNKISAPTHALTTTIAFSGSLSWVCRVAAGQRSVEVINGSGVGGKLTEFSITYMV